LSLIPYLNKDATLKKEKPEEDSKVPGSGSNDRFTVCAYGKTDTGLKRGHNEDLFYLYQDESLFLVADGMGGHSCGEVASFLAVESIVDFFVATGEDQDKTWPFRMDRTLKYEENRLLCGVRLSNQRIYDQAQSDQKYRGMGTTIVSMLVKNNEIYLGHVGDSRGYIVRESQIEQLTEDHSLLNDFKKARPMTKEEIDNFPHKNIIVRALGMRDTVQVDMSRIIPNVNDAFILCSDGLSGMLSNQEMLDIYLENQDNLKLCCEKMIELANKAGGMDNITVIVIRLYPQGTENIPEYDSSEFPSLKREDEEELDMEDIEED